MDPTPIAIHLFWKDFRALALIAPQRMSALNGRHQQLLVQVLGQQHWLLLVLTVKSSSTSFLLLANVERLVVKVFFSFRALLHLAKLIVLINTTCMLVASINYDKM